MRIIFNVKISRSTVSEYFVVKTDGAWNGCIPGIHMVVRHILIERPYLVLPCFSSLLITANMDYKSKLWENSCWICSYECIIRQNYVLNHYKSNATVSVLKPSLHEFAPVKYRRMSSGTTTMSNTWVAMKIPMLNCCYVVSFIISCVQGTDDSVRSCFIKFALSFLVIGGDHVIRAILELKGV